MTTKTRWSFMSRYLFLLGCLFFFTCEKSQAQYSYTITQAPFSCGIVGAQPLTSAGYAIVNGSSAGTQGSATYNTSALVGGSHPYVEFGLNGFAYPNGTGTNQGQASMTATITGPNTGLMYGVTVQVKIKSRCLVKASGYTGSATAMSDGPISVSVTSSRSNPMVSQDSGVVYSPPLNEMVYLSAVTGTGALTVGGFFTSLTYSGGMSGEGEGHSFLVAWISSITGPAGTVTFPEPPNPPLP
jgi:hypothetical protein